MNELSSLKIFASFALPTIPRNLPHTIKPLVRILKSSIRERDSKIDKRVKIQNRWISTSALMIGAAKYGYLDLVMECYQISPRGAKMAIFSSARHGNINILKFLLQDEKNLNLGPHLCNGLISASEKGHINCIDLILQKRNIVYSCPNILNNMLNVAIKGENRTSVTFLCRLINSNTYPFSLIKPNPSLFKSHTIFCSNCG